MINKTCLSSILYFSACTSYGTTFQLYPKRRIVESNAYVILDVSVKECTDACLSDALCASFDYKSSPVSRCHIQYVNVRIATTFFGEISDYDLHVRDCA